MLIPKLGTHKSAGVWSGEKKKSDADSQQMQVWVAFHRNQQINPMIEFFLPSSSPKSNALEEKGGCYVANVVMLKA